MNHLNHALAQYIILLFIFTIKFLEWRGKITKQNKVYSRSTISRSFDKRNSFVKTNSALFCVFLLLSLAIVAFLA